ncbi:SWR1-complex protein 3 [Ranunculus cassubicifolius]
MEKWSELPEDIIDIFAKKLPPDVEEFARFGVVCKSWKASADNEKKRIVHFAPYEDNEQGTRSFYSLYSKRIINIELPTQGRRCWGTPYGWVVTMGLDLNIHLLNPLSGERLSLPPQCKFGNQYSGYVEPQHMCQVFVKKFALASNPSLDHTPLVMAIHGEYRTLAFATPGDKVWTSVEGPFGECTADVIYFNDHFYSLDREGMLRVCDINSTPPTAIKVASPPDGVNPLSTFYLVEISGELHLVARVFSSITKKHGDENEVEGAGDAYGGDKEEDSNYHHYATDYFVVFKFNFHTEKWTETEDVGNHSLFLGNNASFSMSSTNLPELKGNCVYYTDDHTDLYKYRYCDMGRYDIKEDNTDPIHTSKDKFSKFSRPLFFIPTPL